MNGGAGTGAPTEAARAPSASAAPESAPEIVVREHPPAAPRKRRWTRVAYKAVVGWLAVVLAACLRVLGPAIAIRLGRFFGIAGYHLRAADRRIAMESLAIAFPEKSEAERARIARESFARVGMCALEWIAITRRRGYTQRVTLAGREHLDACRARGKGVMWVTGHVGNWELMAAKVADDYPCAVIATTVRYPRVNRMSIEERARFGVGTVERESPNAGRELLKLFRKNAMLGILMDHDTRIPSVQVEFFGRPAWTAIGPAELSLRLQVPVVSGFMQRRADGTHYVEVATPIFPPEKVAKADQVRVARDLTQQYTKRIEDHVRAHPEDWAWMHRRWKP